MSAKWFYSIQDNAKEYLKNNYDSFFLNSQEVQKDFIYESYSCMKAERHVQVLIMMNKRNQFAIYEMVALVNCPTKIKLSGTMKTIDVDKNNILTTPF